MADSNLTEKGSKSSRIKRLWDGGKNIIKKEKETNDSLLNRFTGYKSSPFQLFFLVTLILITMSISSSTGGYPLRLFAEVVAFVMTLIISSINFIFNI